METEMMALIDRDDGDRADIMAQVDSDQRCNGTT